MLRPDSTARTALRLLIGGDQRQHRIVVLVHSDRGNLHPDEPEQARNIADQARGFLAILLASATRRLAEPRALRIHQDPDREIAQSGATAKFIEPRNPSIRLR